MKSGGKNNKTATSALDAFCARHGLPRGGGNEANEHDAQRVLFLLKDEIDKICDCVHSHLIQRAGMREAGMVDRGARLNLRRSKSEIKGAYTAVGHIYLSIYTGEGVNAPVHHYHISDIQHPIGELKAAACTPEWRPLGACARGQVPGTMLMSDRLNELRLNIIR